MDKTPNPFLYSLRLPVSTPPSIHYAVIISHSISLMVPWLSTLSMTHKSLICLLVLISLVLYYSRWGSAGLVRDIDQLVLDADDDWFIQYRNGDQDKAVFGHYQFVNEWLTVLSLRRENKHLFFVYTPEILEPDEFRRLRVRIMHRLKPVN